MTYIKTNWRTGDIIESEKLNKIEQGIADIDSRITTVQSNCESGTYFDNISPDNIGWDANYSLSDVIGNIDMSKGDLQSQIDSTTVQIDPTLRIAGAAADAQVVGATFQHFDESIIADVIYYLATPEDEDVSWDTAGWTTTPQTMTSTNKYLWIYHAYRRANERAQRSEPVIIGVFSGGEVVTSPNWNEIDSSSPAYIQNKPAIKAGVGSNSIIESGGSEATQDDAHAEGTSTKARGVSSHAEGSGTIASGNGSHAEGCQTTASGYASHAEGQNTTASQSNSHAEGNGTNATGQYSHAEGSTTTASGMDSHAEGKSTTASGSPSHAEGENTIASGSNSHAEGSSTTASGYGSHAEGQGTVAQRAYQHVFGQYNVTDTEGQNELSQGKYIEIVGRGSTMLSRANARTLDWSGNEYLAGNLTLGNGLVPGSLALGNTALNESDLKLLLRIKGIRSEIGNEYIGDETIRGSIYTLQAQVNSLNHDYQQANSTPPTTIQNDSAAVLSQITLAPGIYILTGTAEYEDSNLASLDLTGIRSLRFSKRISSSADYQGFAAVHSPATRVTGENTVLTLTTVLHLEASQTSIYLIGYQNSGSSLGVKSITISVLAFDYGTMLE